MSSFKNKTVIITGAAGNLGRAVANLFERKNANRVLVDADIHALEQGYSEETEKLLKSEVDLMKEEEVEKLV